jgi:4-amino-4-deoxy-L-arabinose transferase-like glycosyltransferase
MDERYSILLSRTCVVGCLLGLCGTWYFLVGLAGYVSSSLLNFSVVIVLVAAAFFFTFNFLEIPRATSWLGKIIWAAILVILIVEIVLGVLPPTSRDELAHHLAIPKLYARAGRIIEVPMAPYSYYPMLIDMLYTPWVFWGYDFVAKWIHALFGFLTGLLLYAYCAGRMNAIYGLLGFFLFVSTPVIARLSHWGYIDLGTTFYTTASLICLILWREHREAVRWLTLAALLLGFALATKPNGLVAALLISLLFLLVVVKPAQKDSAQISRELIFYSGLALLPFLPWLVKNWVQTGNPFFPLLGHFFSQRGVSDVESASFGGLGIFVKRELLYGENLWQILSLPLRVFFSGRDDNPRLFDGVLTPVLVVLLPWAFKGKWLDDKKLLVSFAFLFLFYAIFLVDLRIRYILPIVPPLVILAVYGIFNVYLRIKKPVYLFVGVMVVATWHGVYLWRYVSAAQPLGYLSGSEKRETYLGRMLPEYASFEYINSATAPTAKIYLLFIGRRSYYCDRGYFHDGGDLPGYLLGIIRAANKAEQIDQALKRKQITHLIVREDLLVDFLTHNLTPGQAATWSQFAQRYLTLNFRDRGHAVYQLHG